MNADSENKHQHGIAVHYGLSETPKLPEGWCCDKVQGRPVVVRSPDGSEFLLGLGNGLLYAWKKCPADGIPGSTLKPGQSYIDTKNPIRLIT